MTKAHVCLGIGAPTIVLLLAIGFYAVSLFNKYSPVYKDISIGTAEPVLDGIEAGGGSLKFHLDIKVMLKNPNSYDVELDSLRQGRVLLAPERIDVGSIEAMPATLQAGKEIAFPFKAVVQLSGFNAILLVARLMRGPVRVYLEIALEAKIEENLLVKSIEMRPFFVKKCGVALDVGQGISGGLACANAFKDLHFCEIDDPTCEGVVCRGSDCMMVDEETMKDAEKQRDLYLGLAMGLAFSLTLIIACCTGVILAQEFKRRKSARVEDTAGLSHQAAGQVVFGHTILVGSMSSRVEDNFGLSH